MKGKRLRRGETLVEALCAVLVISLGAALLAGAVASVSRVNEAAIRNDDKLYASISSAEAFAGQSHEEQLKIIVGDRSTSVTVDVFGNVVKSYRRSEG